MKQLAQARRRTIRFRISGAISRIVVAWFGLTAPWKALHQVSEQMRKEGKRERDGGGRSIRPARLIGPTVVTNLELSQQVF